MGRPESFRSAQRPIDLDILFYNDLVSRVDALEIPHLRLQERAFVLVPLAEIAPDLMHPVLKVTVKELLRGIDRKGVIRVERSLKLRIEHDVQQAAPLVPISLSRAGVTNLSRIIQIANGSRGVLFHAELDIFADLKPEQAGVHMSRFSNVLEAVTAEILPEPSPDIESLAKRLAQQVVRTQYAIRSEVHIRAHSPMMKVTPISAKPVEELYTLISMASSTQEHTRCLVGVGNRGDDRLPVCAGYGP